MALKEQQQNKNTAANINIPEAPSSDSLSWDKDAIGACISPRGTPRSEGALPAGPGGDPGPGVSICS